MTAFSNWLNANKSLPGLLGLAISAPGRPALVENCNTTISKAALENAWRCVTETFPVIQLNQFPTACFRFVFGQAVVHCERREDGTCVGIFAPRDSQTFSPDEIQRLLAEFHALPQN